MARCGPNLLRDYYCTLAQTPFYNLSFQGVQVEARHTPIETIDAANQVLQSSTQIPNIDVFCSDDPSHFWMAVLEAAEIGITIVRIHLVN